MDVEITAYPDGPYLVRGDYTLTDEAGAPIEVRRKVIALCRCGRSANKPFCDGTHKLTGFRAAGSEADPSAQRQTSPMVEDAAPGSTPSR